MTTRTLTGRARRAARWAACAATVALCVVGVVAPTPAMAAIPTPAVSLTERPEMPIVPDVPIEVWIDVRSTHIKDASGDYVPARELHMSFDGGLWLTAVVWTCLGLLATSDMTVLTSSARAVTESLGRRNGRLLRRL